MRRPFRRSSAADALFRRILPGQPLLEICKWRIGCNSAICARQVASAFRGLQLPLMFVVVAVQTEQFPIAAIRRVVGVIVITVVYCQLAQVGAGEHSSAAAAYPWINLQRSLAIALRPLVGGPASVCDDSIQLARVIGFHVVTLRAYGRPFRRCARPDR